MPGTISSSPAPRTRARAFASAEPWIHRAGRWSFFSWPLGVLAFWQWSPAVAGWYFLGAHAVALYGTFRANAQIFGAVVRSFATADREVWLTIDDGPFEEDTRAMLEVLRAHAATATFFLEGARVRKQPHLARAIVEAGHHVANHTETHPVVFSWALGRSSARKEIQNCQEALRAACGAASAAFRPPLGMANPFLHAAARRLGLPVVGWTARGFDGVDRDPARVLGRLLPRLKPGAIFLLHQRKIGSTGAALLEAFLQELAQRGFRCVVPEPARYRTHCPR